MAWASRRVGRYLATANLTKFRVFIFLDGRTLADHQLIAFARDDDYFLGLLHSSVHTLWAFRMGTQVREAESGFRYTPSSSFETFPLPWAPEREPAGDPAVERIAAALGMALRLGDLAEVEGGPVVGRGVRGPSGNRRGGVPGAGGD